MLKRLYIKNYALIDEMDIEFQNGFNVITGETGAGKSIIMDALSLILGNRADTDVLQDKTQKCIVEAEFLFKNEFLKSFLEQNEVDDSNSFIIRRELAVNGKSRSFINDTPATLLVIKELTKQLVDIHSQHETLDIVNSINQFEIIDSFCGTSELCEKFNLLFDDYKKMIRTRDELIIKNNQYQKEKDYNTFLLDEITKISPKDEEENQLEDQQKLLANADGLRTQLYAATSILKENSGAVSQIRELNNLLSKVKLNDENFDLLRSRVQSVFIELNDIESELDDTLENIQANPEKLQEIDNRLNSLNHLFTKHRIKSSHELLEIQNELEEKLKITNDLEDEIKKYELKIDKANDELISLGNSLFDLRLKQIPKFEKQILQILSTLNMPHAKLSIDLKRNDEVCLNGNAQIEFLFAANKGSELKSIAKVASGGEFSRLMLALKAIGSKEANEMTMIFDEIDAGVSGEVAGKMGELMRELSKKAQVFSITHLPQVAVKGEYHFKVIKRVEGKKTVSNMILLDNNNRVEEIAKMLSGEKLTPEAIANAKVLMQ